MMKGVNVDEKALVRVEAIINSMTPYERANHQIINGSRKRRISSGSGVTVNDVNRLLKQFAQMKKMMKQFGGGKSRDMAGMMAGRGGFR
jgi:signal recognition particle subunit SRP54